MSSLSSYKLDFEELPLTTRMGGKDSKMSKQPKVEAPAKSYNKTRGEHVKDVLIAVLVAGIVAFIGGMQFANKQNATVDEAVKAVTLTEQAEATPASK